MATRRAIGGWKRRFVVLRGSRMVVYRDASVSVLKSELMVAGGSVEFLFEQAAGGGSGSVRFGMRLTLASGKASDWACDEVGAGVDWLEALTAATKLGAGEQLDGMAEVGSVRGGQPMEAGGHGAPHAVSCDLFEEHPIFGFSQCRVCGVGKAHHFSARLLLEELSDRARECDGEKERELLAPGYSLPLRVKREGWLLVRKKAQRFGGWKRR